MENLVPHVHCFIRILNCFRSPRFLRHLLFEDVVVDELRGNARRQYSEARQYSESLDPIVSREPVDWSNETFCLHKTEITEEGKMIVFERQGEQITVYFPPYCVLGTRYVGIRVQNDVHLDEGREMVTPFLYITQPTNTPFLRKVRVTLPLKNIPSDIETANSVEGRNIKVNRKEKICIVEAFNFSPVGAVLDKTNMAISALTLSSNERRRLFKVSSKYLLVEQKEKQPNEEIYRLCIEYRTFHDWQEHTKFLGQRNCFLREMTKPGMANADMTLKITVPDGIQLTSGESVLTLPLSDKSDTEVVEKYKFNLSNSRSLEMKIEDRNGSMKQYFGLLSKDDLDRDIQNPCPKPVISEFLKKLGDHWLECLTEVLNINQISFSEFIWEDIKDATPDPAKSEEARQLYDKRLSYGSNLEDAKTYIMKEVFRIEKSGELEEANRVILAEIMTHKDNLKDCLAKMKDELLTFDAHAFDNKNELSLTLRNLLFPEYQELEPMVV